MRTQIILIIAMIFLSVTSRAQKKAIYYYVDTAVHVPKVEIGIEGKVLTYYHFFYQVYHDSPRELSFTYRNDRNISEIVLSKPKHQYWSFNKLVKTIRKVDENGYFNKVYDIFFVEALPNNRYITNKVGMVANKSFPVQSSSKK